MTDQLTDNGLLSDHQDVTMANYTGVYGEPAVSNDTVVIFADDKGHELNEWADLLEIDRTELSERMHELAREHYGDRRGRGSKGGDPWSVADPIVFNAETFE